MDIIAGETFKPSENDYDWLGHGIYFWEANPARGLQFIQEVQRRRAGTPFEIRDPWVIGAVIDLGFCLDLLSSSGIAALLPVHASFVNICRRTGTIAPVNDGGSDLLKRGLDCAVINHLHRLREEASLNPFDSVRGVFIEGPRIYPDSGFREKTHVQICVRNQACIKGTFRVPSRDLAPA